MDSWILSAWRERQETQTAAPNVSGVCARAYIYTIISSSSSSSSSPKFFFKQDNRQGEKERKKEEEGHLPAPSELSILPHIVIRRTLHPTFSIYTFLMGRTKPCVRYWSPGVWVKKKWISKVDTQDTKRRRRRKEKGEEEGPAHP